MRIEVEVEALLERLKSGEITQEEFVKLLDDVRAKAVDEARSSAEASESSSESSSTAKRLKRASKKARSWS